MSSPFLDIAIGALRGSQANRQERTATEERRRRQRREDLELQLLLDELGATPFLDAATQGAPGAAAPPEAPAPPPIVGRGGLAGRIPRPEEPGLALPAPGGPPAPWPPGASGTRAAPPGREAVPGAPATPFLDEAIGEVEVGGTKFRVPSKRRRTEAANRAAWEALHRADPEAYPEYIEGLREGYYAEELSDYAQGVRAGRIEDRRAAREGRTAAARQAADARRDAARDEVFSLAQEGKSFEEVVAAISGDHELRGALTRSEIRREMQSAGQINAPARETAQRISTLKTQLGKPPTPRQGDAPLSAQDQQEIIEALAEGATAEQIIEVYQGHPGQRTVQRWLRRGRQFSAPPLNP